MGEQAGKGLEALYDRATGTKPSTPSSTGYGRARRLYRGRASRKNHATPLELVPQIAPRATGEYPVPLRAAGADELGSSYSSNKYKR